MKKRKLELLDLSSFEVLSRSQLQNVLGGSGCVDHGQTCNSSPNTTEGKCCSGYKCSVVELCIPV